MSEYTCFKDEVYVPEPKLDEIVEPEVGSEVEIRTPHGNATATWLGPVGMDENGDALPGCLTFTEACKLMCRLSDEKKAGENGRSQS